MIRYIPTTKKLLVTLWILILLAWWTWIIYSWLKPNEFGDAINPLINLITIIFLYLNWISLKEELNEEKRVNKKHEWVNIWATEIKPIKDWRDLLKWLGRWDTDFDPLWWINLKLKNFWVYPTYLEGVKLIKINPDWSKENYNNVDRNFVNIIFPGVEIEGILNIWAPNEPNESFKWVKLVYELTFSNEVDTKILRIDIWYIWFFRENKEIWYVPVVWKQRIA